MNGRAADLRIDQGHQYLVQANSSSEGETAMTEPIIAIYVPSGEGSCSAHLVNRSVKVEGTNATVEFGGIRASSFTCKHVGHQNQSQPCVFITLMI